ncbi:MAG: hypothetical protein ACPGOV_03520 [Magnetovibrionaceae bacterium]
MASAAHRKEAEKLTKVVAYLDSDQDGEVLAALRAAKRLIAARGQSLEDVLIGALAPVSENRDQAGGPADPLLELHIRELQGEVSRLRKANQTLRGQLARKNDECDGWRELAWANRRSSKRI